MVTILKKLSSYLLIGVILGIGIATGATVGASAVSLAQSMFSSIRTTVRSNTDAKLANVGQEIQTQLGSTFEVLNTQQTNRANTEIDAYYNQKVGSLSTDPRLNDTMNEVVQMTSGLIAEEKARIDQAVDAALGGQ